MSDLGPETDNQDDERPEWLPEKFDSAEALAKSYTELERQHTQAQQHSKALEDNYAALSGQIEELRAQKAQPDQDEVNQQWLASYEADPMATMSALAQQVATETAQRVQAAQKSDPAIVARLAEQEIAAKYSDFDTERSRVIEEVAGNPLFQNEAIWQNTQTAAAALDHAYTLVKGKDLLAGKLGEQAAGYDVRAAKLAAQTATGGNPRPDAPDPAKAEWERIKNAGGGSYQDLMTRS